jgi:predicted dehydrogenase
MNCTLADSGKLAMCNTASPTSRTSIIGSNGGVRLNPFGFFKSYGNLDVDGAVNLGSANYRWHNVGTDGIYYSESQRHWIGALEGKVPLLPTAEIALNTMLISEGIYLSEREDREVTAAEVLSYSSSTAVDI